MCGHISQPFELLLNGMSQDAFMCAGPLQFVNMQAGELYLEPANWVSMSKRVSMAINETFP